MIPVFAVRLAGVGSPPLPVDKEFVSLTKHSFVFLIKSAARYSADFIATFREMRVIVFNFL